jgi:glycine/D-amino acid oxidase-like deaminating enzyme
MENQSWDVGLVGQGLAGTVLHAYLQRAGYRCCVWDPGSRSCSTISSGILNPLTGRKYVKSWLFDDLLSEAKTFYTRLEHKLKARFFYERPIFRALPDRRAENEWDYRSSLPNYSEYVGGDASMKNLPSDLRKSVPYISILKGHQLRISRLIAAYREYLKKSNCLFSEYWNHDLLHRERDVWRYKEMRCKKIIFCEGAAAIHNPLLSGLPFNLSKGEAVIVRKSATLSSVVKRRIFSVPWESGEWWLGAANFWNYEDDKPTDIGQARIMTAYADMYTGQRPPVVTNLAAIKPTVRDRKPLLGRVDSGAYVFNGLGTKGASLAPFFARQLVHHIKDGQSLMDEVNINGRWEDSA